MECNLVLQLQARKELIDTAVLQRVKTAAVSTFCIIPRLHDQANIEQTSSKKEACIKHSLQEANIKQSSSKHRADVRQLAHVFQIHLLDVCLMFA